MSNFCKRRARQIASEVIRKIIVKVDLQATPESIEQTKAVADRTLQESPLGYTAVVELCEDQRGVVIDVRESSEKEAV